MIPCKLGAICHRKKGVFSVTKVRLLCVLIYIFIGGKTHNDIVHIRGHLSQEKRCILSNEGETLKGNSQFCNVQFASEKILKWPTNCSNICTITTSIQPLIFMQATCTH